MADRVFVLTLETGELPDEIRLLSIENGQERFLTFSEFQLQREKTQLIQAAHSIASHKFYPNPGHHCRICDFRTICPRNQMQ